MAGGLDPPGRLGAGLRVAVEADQPESGVGVEHRERVAGQPEGGVDEDGAVGGAGGGEEFGDAFEEDGHVHRAVPRGPCAAHRRLPLEIRVCAPDGAARGGAAVGRGAKGRVTVPVGRRAGVVGRGGDSGAKWGPHPVAGRSRPRGVRLASGKSVRWSPAGAWVDCPVPAPGRSPMSGPSRGEGGWGPVRSSRGEGGSFGFGRGTRGRLWDTARRPGSHDSVGIPSLSMSA